VSRAAAVLAARVVALVGALGALGWALGSGARGDPAPGVYVCPMHPQARAPSPGRCAICRMALRAPAPPTPAIRDDVVGTPLPLTVAREVRAPAWRDGDGVTALLYADEVALLAPHETARVHLGRRVLRVRRDDTPPRRWDDATFHTRWQLLETARPDDGDVGALELAPRTRPALVVPYSAVIAAPAGPFVLIVDGNALLPRPIVTGRALYDFITVLDGVGPTEHLIVRDAIAFDQQRRLATEAR
jgi:hypothetical protein